VVYTNDPDRAKFSIGIKAVVQVIFSGSPKERFIIFTTVGKPAGQTITLTNTLSEPIKIIRISHNLGDAVQVKIRPVISGRSYQVTVHTEAAEVLKKAGYVRLTLSGAPAPEYLINAYVFVRKTKKIFREPSSKKE